MRNVWRHAFVALLVTSLAACSLLKKKGDEADASGSAEASVAEVPDSAPPPAPTASAENEDDVARFPDEKKLDSVAATVQRPSNIREAPQVGNVVTALAKGTNVAQISQRDKYFLVVADNPKDTTKKLMGWIHQDSFSPAPVVDAGVKALTCAKGEMALFSDGPFCAKVCAADGECPAGQACKGSAQKLVNGKPGDSVTVCTVFHAHDAGAPKADAGLATGVDGGLGGLGGLRPLGIDAGGGTAPAASDVVDPVGTRCPAGYQYIAKDKRCHKICTNFDCKRETQFCIKCDNAKVCSANRDLCK